MVRLWLHFVLHLLDSFKCDCFLLFKGVHVVKVASLLDRVLLALLEVDKFSFVFVSKFKSRI